MNLRGQIVTIINLSMKIGFSPSVIGPKSRIVIIDSKDERIGLLVDRVTEVIATPKKEIDEPPANIKGAQGKFFEGILQTDRKELMALLNVEVVLDEES
jgi:purine-binding chemotaxis protein CheW